MERIQSAIEKARKAREEEHETPVPEVPVRKRPTAESAPEKVASEDVWKELKPFHPKSSRLKHNRILAYEACPEAAPYDMLRTKLIQQMRKNGWRRVAITSHGASSGKTMTTLNLAFSLARQNDLKTMAIDLDMRRPSMAKTLGIRERVQFSQALAEKEPIEDHILRYGSNLAFAANQSSTRNSAEMLQGVTAARVLDQVEKIYDPDIIIFDTPPLMASDDTLAFLDQVDCVLFVVEAEQTTPSSVDKCEQELAARTNVLGVILNKCRYMDRTERYANYYGT